MTTITTLATETATAVKVLWKQLNDKKGWTIDTITAVYAIDPAVTPEHLVVGLTGNSKQNKGFIYAAWAVHKKLVSDAGMLNINWLAANYSKLVFDSTLGAQITALKDGQKAEALSAHDTAITNGTYTVEGLTDLEAAFTLASKLPISSNKAVGDKLSALRLQLEALQAKYDTALALSI